MGYEKLPPLAWLLLLFTELRRKLWEWILGGMHE